MVGRAGTLVLIAVAGTAPAGGCPTAPAERYEPRSFFGYACDGDCERHKTGFAWAESHAVADASLCGALGRAEAEGCRAYVGEPVASDEAGFRWALENEVQVACLCAGAGERFLAGCLRALGVPFGAME
jgi:hypothetical protein